VCAVGVRLSIDIAIKRKKNWKNSVFFVYCFNWKFSSTNTEVICAYIIKINGICGVGHVNENKRDKFLQSLSHMKSMLTGF